MNKLMTRAEAANVLGISITTLDLERKQGRLAFIQPRANGKVLITEESINRYIAEMNRKATVVDGKTKKVINPIMVDTVRKRRGG